MNFDIYKFIETTLELATNYCLIVLAAITFPLWVLPYIIYKVWRR